MREPSLSANDGMAQVKRVAVEIVSVARGLLGLQVTPAERVGYIIKTRARNVLFIAPYQLAVRAPDAVIGMMIYTPSLHTRLASHASKGFVRGKAVLLEYEHVQKPSRDRRVRLF